MFFLHLVQNQSFSPSPVWADSLLKEAKPSLSLKVLPVKQSVWRWYWNEKRHQLSEKHLQHQTCPCLFLLDFTTLASRHVTIVFLCGSFALSWIFVVDRPLNLGCIRSVTERHYRNPNLAFDVNQIQTSVNLKNKSTIVVFKSQLGLERLAPVCDVWWWDSRPMVDVCKSQRGGGESTAPSVALLIASHEAPALLECAIQIIQPCLLKLQTWTWAQTCCGFKNAFVSKIPDRDTWL